MSELWRGDWTRKLPVAATPFRGRLVMSVHVTSPSAVMKCSPGGAVSWTMNSTVPKSVGLEDTADAGEPPSVIAKSYSSTVPSGSVKVPASSEAALSTMEPVSAKVVGLLLLGCNALRW